MQQLEYKPAGLAPEDKTRVKASVWATAIGSGYWVIPLDGGPRRFVLVRSVKHVWTEIP